MCEIKKAEIKMVNEGKHIPLKLRSGTDLHLKVELEHLQIGVTQRSLYKNSGRQLPRSIAF